MKQLGWITLIVVIAGVSVACTLSSTKLIPNTALNDIQPGDRIGDFLITTGNREEEVFVWQMRPSYIENSDEVILNVELGQMLNPCAGIFDDTHKADLDLLWSQKNYELYIDDRPVDLPSFGTVQSLHPEVGMMRHWNVVLVAEKPGRISVRVVGRSIDRSGDDVTLYTVLSP